MTFTEVVFCPVFQEVNQVAEVVFCPVFQEVNQLACCLSKKALDSPEGLLFFEE